MTGPTLHARLPYGWPIYALFLGFPVWWLLGLGELIWPVFAVPMGLSLLGRRKVYLPRGFGFYVLFLMWMMASAMEITGPDRMIGFAYRASLYISAGIAGLYVYNAPKRLFPTNTIVRTMAYFWGIVVVGGFLGLLMPTLEFATLAERLMPQRLLANDFVRTLVHPTTAQIQTFLGYNVPRPRAPFVYTNDWGGNFALLVPFVVAAWATIRSITRKSVVRLVALASILPVVFSLNRVLWFCLIVTLIYGSARFAIRGRKGGLQGVAAVCVVAFVVINFGPTSTLIADRVNTPHSNEGRARLYNEAADSVGRSPLLGYGAPRPSQANPNLPSVGTQGQFWLVLFSHGVPGAVLFVSFIWAAMWRTRNARTPVGLWCHVVLLVAFLQMPFYGLLPTQLVIVMIAMATAAREVDFPDPPEVLPDPAPVLVAAGGPVVSPRRGALGAGSPTNGDHPGGPNGRYL